MLKKEIKVVLFCIITLTLFISAATYADTLQSPWVYKNIGLVDIKGKGTFENGNFILENGGENLFVSESRFDEFLYVYRTLSGDGEIIAKVESISDQNPKSIAGLMIRNSSNNRKSSFVMISVSNGNGSLFNYRDYRGAKSNNIFSNDTRETPQWLKLKRSGHTFTGYLSSDNQTWEKISSIDVPMHENVLVGMAVTGYTWPALNKCVFSNVDFDDNPPEDDGVTGEEVAPVITDVLVSIISSDSATILWDTDIPSTSQVRFGTGLEKEHETALDTNLVTEHEVRLTDLLPDTVYHFSLISANESGKESQSKDFTFSTISVDPTEFIPNNLPILDKVGDKFITEGENLTFSVTASDIDDDVLSYSATNLPIGALFDKNSQTFNWTPDFGQAGVYGISFKVTDGLSVVSEDMEITVNKTDTVAEDEDVLPPEITNVQIMPITSNSATITWQTDEEADSQIEYGTDGNLGSLTQIKPIFMTFHLGEITGLEQGTEYFYRVISVDPSGNSGKSEEFSFKTLKIDTDNTSPILFPIGDKIVTEGENLTFSVTASDIDDDVLSYSATNLPLGALFDKNQQTFNWTPDFGQAGVYDISFKVTDGLSVVSEDMEITVNKTDNVAEDEDVLPPEITNVQIMPITSNSATITWQTDEEADSQIEYGTDANLGSLTQISPIFMTFHLGEITNLNQDTEYFYRVISVDPSGNSAKSEEFSFKTLKFDTDNTSPILFPIGDKIVNEGELLQFTVFASDTDEDTLNFSTDDLPSTATFIANTFNWIPDSESQGVYSVKFKVSDGTDSDIETVTITVNDMPEKEVEILRSLTSFADIEHALPETIYTSNSMIPVGFLGELTVAVSGGINTTIVKNGIATGLTSTSLVKGDTIALQSKSPSSVGAVATIDVKIADMDFQWKIVTDEIKPLPTVSGTMAGYTPGILNVNEAGNATYSIPIKVSPGTAGLQPELGLTYNSSMGNTPLGMGWSISGLSAITRVSANLAQEKSWCDGIDFDKNDRFALDGERLVVVQGIYGEINSEYRTEHDSFQQVVAIGQQVNSPQSFKVQTKSGLVMYYGATQDSRIEAHGRQDVLVWALNRVEDTVGNYMTITYDEVGSNSEYYPIQMAYTGNQKASSILEPYNFVKFVYEDRPDKVTKYIYGSPVLISKRLKRIETHNFALDNIYRAYNLTYGETAIGRKSFLKSVQEEGIDGTLLPPTTFTWQGIDDNFNFQGTNSGIWTGHSMGGAETVTADFDANGKLDIAAKKDGEGSIWQVCLVNDTGNGFRCEEWDIIDKGKIDVRFADFNGDMIPDVIKKSDTGLDMWKVRLGTGNGFVDAPNGGLWSGPVGSIQDAFFADYNGDGLSDIAIQVPNQPQWHVGLSSGTGFDKAGSGIWPGPSSGSVANTIAADFSGDGKVDLAARVTVQKNLWHVAISDGLTGFTGDGSGMWTGLNSDVDKTYVGDFNRDGISDLVGWETDEKRGKISLSTGTGFKVFNTDVWDTHNGLRDGKRNNFVVDINHDGYADLLKKNDQNPGTWNAYVSTGNNFMRYEKIPAHNGELDSSFFLDLTGDGLPDLMTPTSGDQWQVQLTDGFKPLLITNITNGHGAQNSIEYKPLTDPSVHTKDNDADISPRFDLAAPIYVVSSFKKSNGIGGFNSFGYHYTGAEMNRAGRGFRGFRKIDITDPQKNLLTTTHYDQNHRFVATKVLSKEERVNGVLVSKVDNTLGVKIFGPFGAKYFYSFVESSELKNYELDSSLITTTKSTNELDDFGNLLKSIITVVDGNNIFTTTNKHKYKNDFDKWILGQLIRSEVTKEVRGSLPLTRTYGFEYSPITTLLVKEIIEPDDPKHRLVTDYVHDEYGNIIQNTVSGEGFKPRAKSSEYNSKKRFVLRTKNALGHEDVRAYKLTNLVSLTGANGLTTTWNYDGFGRKRLETRPDGNLTRTSYFLTEQSSLRNAKYYVRTDTSGAPLSITYYDILDRAIRKETLGFDGKPIFVDTIYNNIGQVIQRSEPYFKGEVPLWTNFEYDSQGRLIKEIAPGNRMSRTQYKGLITIVTDPKNQTRETERNGVGKIVRVRDNLLTDTLYHHGPFLNLDKVTDSEGNTTRIEYDIRGNKTLLNDNDTGVTIYKYNALGELVKENDANGNIVTFEYDLLGRVVRKDELEGVTTWVYDTRPNGIGKPSSVFSENGFIQEYYYGSFGRLRETITSIDETRNANTNSYDQYGRQDTITYPTGLSVQSIYNTFGYNSEIRRVSDDHLYWKMDAIDARGQFKQQTFGNGLVTTRIYDPATGNINRIVTGGVQDLDFTFDIVGNFIQRRDLARNLQEDFLYDKLNRLINTSVVNDSSVQISYDNLGNITYKSDVGLYSYGNASPHAVTSISGVMENRYNYDSNGNRISSIDGTVRYTSYNKPFEINNGTNQIKFRYGPNRNRFEQVVLRDKNIVSTKHYVGTVFEREITPSLVKDIHYIKSAGKTIAIETLQSDGENYIRYLHRDHISSVETITDENGAVVESLSYDAWGKRRFSDDWSSAVSVSSVTTERGFTGHEHLDYVSLIHMNGRSMDPVIGRFLSPDPFIQTPDFSQSLNRYSYVLNNPLTLVDPSGYFFKNIFRSIGRILREHKTTIISAAVGFVTGGVAGPLIASGLQGVGFTLGAASIIGSGAAMGFGSSFTASVLTGGSLADGLRSGLLGGVTGGIAAGTSLGFAFNNADKLQFSDFASIAANGVVDGALSELQGGEFKDAFKSSVLFGSIRLSIDKVMKPFTNQVAINSGEFKRDPVTSEIRTDGTLAVEDIYGNTKDINGDPLTSKSIFNFGSMGPQSILESHGYNDSLFKRTFINNVSKVHDFFNGWGYNVETGRFISRGVVYDSLFDVYSFACMLPAAVYRVTGDISRSPGFVNRLSAK